MAVWKPVDSDTSVGGVAVEEERRVDGGVAVLTAPVDKEGSDGSSASVFSIGSLVFSNWAVLFCCSVETGIDVGISVVMVFVCTWISVVVVVVQFDSMHYSFRCTTYSVSISRPFCRGCCCCCC